MLEIEYLGLNDLIKGDKMIIILTSKNPSKKRSLDLALKELGIKDYEILCIPTASEVSSKPIGIEIIRGAENRNKNALKYALKNNITFDYLCSVEGGYTIDEMGHYFITTYSVIEDNKGKLSTGQAMGLRIRKDTFDYIKSGKSLNELIEKISTKKSNKENEGITGFLSNGLISRDKMEKDSIITAFIPFIYIKQRDDLSRAIELEKSI